MFDNCLVFDTDTDTDHRVLKSVLDIREKDYIEKKTILSMEYMSNLRSEDFFFPVFILFSECQSFQKNSR